MYTKDCLNKIKFCVLYSHNTERNRRMLCEWTPGVSDWLAARSSFFLARSAICRFFFNYALCSELFGRLLTLIIRREFFVTLILLILNFWQRPPLYGENLPWVEGVTREPLTYKQKVGSDGEVMDPPSTCWLGWKGDPPSKSWLGWKGDPPTKSWLGWKRDPPSKSWLG